MSVLEQMFLCQCSSYVPASPALHIDHVFLQDDPIGNLNTAFDVAEKFLDIPKMLDAEGKTDPYMQHVLIK